jgi:hypothetical protein
MKKLSTLIVSIILFSGVQAFSQSASLTDPIISKLRLRDSIAFSSYMDRRGQIDAIKDSIANQHDSLGAINNQPVTPQGSITVPQSDLKLYTSGQKLEQGQISYTVSPAVLVQSTENRERRNGTNKR